MQKLHHPWPVLSCGSEPKTIVIIGGRRSGKSSIAESMVLSTGLAPVYFATGVETDGEMRRRIAEHQQRRGEKWRTIEASINLQQHIQKEANSHNALLLDCATTWLNNIQHEGGNVAQAMADLLDTIGNSQGKIVIVSTELGLGVVPMGAKTREFCDYNGDMNQRLTSVCDAAFMCFAGRLLMLK